MLKKIIAIFLSIVSIGMIFTSCAKVTTPENEAPTCNITNPLKNQTITIGEKVLIYGYAMDNDGSIFDAKFYINDVLKKTDYLYPYSYEWDTKELAEGAYSLKLIVSDGNDNDALTATDEFSINLTPYILFSDDSLEAKVSKVVNVAIGEIKPSDVDTLKTLKIEHAKVKKLNGMEFFNSLEVLSLDSNTIFSVKPLKNLQTLKKLHLAHNNISDITDLSLLTELSRLSLDYNSITDIKPLVGIGLAQGDTVSLLGNTLNTISVDSIIPYLEERGVVVIYDK